MSEIPTFTVIVPVYNGQSCVGSAIESILNQSLQCFELIIVDDGSSDESGDIVERARSKRADQIQVVRHPGGENRGIVSTYELGISKARGKYVAFLEQDDRWSEDFLERKARIFQAHSDVGVVFSRYKIIADGWFGREMQLRQWLVRPSLSGERPFDNFANLLKCNNVATFSCFAARRELLQRLEPPPDNSIVYYDWWVLLGLSTQTQFFRDNRSICYWRHGRSTTLGRQHWQQHCRRATEYFTAMYDFLDANFDSLKPEHQRTYRAHSQHIPRFMDLLEQRSAGAFAKFFAINPRWCLSTSASLVVNHAKFARHAGRPTDGSTR